MWPYTYLGTIFSFYRWGNHLREDKWLGHMEQMKNGAKHGNQALDPGLLTLSLVFFCYSMILMSKLLKENEKLHLGWDACEKRNKIFIIELGSYVSILYHVEM